MINPLTKRRKAMQGNPMDMFEEMDEMFARLFTRMDREFMNSFPRADGHRIILWDDGEGLEIPEMRDAAAPVVPVTSEPRVEIHRIGNEVKVIADLPGITEEALRLDVKGTTLIIDAGDADRHYHTSVSLPRVDMATMQKILNNGVLEVSFAYLPDPSVKV
jgi:HSP20 family protein